MERIPASLRALLSHLVDYAGRFPPAALPLAETVARYESYRLSSESWMLNRLVLPAASLGEIHLRPEWRVSLLVGAEPGALPAEVETLETKGTRRLSRDTYCEAPIDSIEGAFAKVRTGGLTLEAIPTTAQVAGFLKRAAVLRMPFKATAGLHHPLRSAHPLTYASDAPCGTMHGFLNVFVAAALAWHGLDGVEDALEETGESAFEFGDEGLGWRGRSLSTEQLSAARRDFAHSFGSCSFEEPVADLRELGLLS